MIYYYQVVNFQHQPIKVFKNQAAAKKHIDLLRETYPDEGFYVVELKVVYFQGDIQ